MTNTSLDNIRKTIEVLCSWEKKIAGTEEEHEAAEYIYEQLENIGLEKIRKHSFDVHKWNPISCTLELTSPIQKSIEAAILPYCQSAGIETRLTLVGQGDNDFSRKDKGTIGLAEWGPRLYLSPYVTYIRALRKSLSGLVLIAPDEGELLKIVVMASGGFLKIPVVSISKEDGKYLSSLLDREEVIVKLNIEVEVGPKSESYNIETVIPGSNEYHGEIIICAHYDSWFKGAADNSAPAAIVLELARYMHEYSSNGGQLNRTLRFLFFGAEESGHTGFYTWDNGSRNYVNQNKDNLSNVAAIFSLDSIGFPPPTPNYIGATSDILDFAQSVKPNLKKAPHVEFYDPPGYGSDHWFFEISGVPTIYSVAFPSKYYHTQKDDPEHLDYTAIEFYLEYLKEAIIKLANQELLPINIFKTLERFRSIIISYSSIKDIPIDFSPIIEKLKDILSKKAEFRKITSKISKNGDSSQITRINKILLSIVNMFNQTIGWVWRQSAPEDIGYLSRLEYIADYMDLSDAIRSLRNMPVANIIPESVEKLTNQDDNPLNWTNVHQPLAMLEAERARIYSLVDEELGKISEMLVTIWQSVLEIIS